MATLRQRQCYAAGCSGMVPTHRLMCATHWQLVPADLRRRVWETYNAWMAGADVRAYLIAILKAKLAVANLQQIEPVLRDSIQAGIDLYEKGGNA